MTFKVNDTVICAFAGDSDKLETHKTYTVVEVEYGGSHLMVADLNGTVIDGSYAPRRFMLQLEMINQVLENARNV